MTNIGIATNKKIIDLYNMMEDGTLIIHPEFQRKLVWNDKHKEAFLDTILKGLPFPEIYFADGEIDLERKSSTRLVVDGQQRLSTIHKYINDESDLVLKQIKKFTELDDEEQTKFFDYSVVIRDLGRIETSVIKEIFNRINSVQYALNAMEINNALYEGEFISAAKEISEHCNLKDLEIFSEYQFARMEDIEFILLVMTTVEANGYFAAHKEVENYIKQYDNVYPNRKTLEEELISLINFVVDLHLDSDSIWLRKSSFFTLVVELTKFIKKYKILPKKEKLRPLLNELHTRILENKNKAITKNKYSEFYYYMYSGTSNQKSRMIRGKLLESCLSTLIK